MAAETNGSLPRRCGGGADRIRLTALPKSFNSLLTGPIPGPFPRGEIFLIEARALGHEPGKLRGTAGRRPWMFESAI